MVTHSDFGVFYEDPVSVAIAVGCNEGDLPGKQVLATS